MEDRLTRQDKKFVEKVIETGNLTKSVQEAYDIEDPKYASVKGQRLIAKDRIQNAIQSIADRIPDDLLEKVHLEGLQAGKKTEEGIEPDFAIRHKYLDSAYKLKGAYSDEATKPPVIFMPILVKFLDKKDDETSSNGNPV